MSLIFSRPAVFTLALTACGARATTDQDSASLVKAEPKGIDPRVAIVPEGAEDEPQDVVFENPLISPTVTSVYQPSYFYDPDEATDPPIEATMLPAPTNQAAAPSAESEAVPEVDPSADFDSGSGDLTMLLVFDKSSSMLFDWDGKTRWQVANESLRAALDGVLDELTIGVVRFPLESSCFVPAFDSGSQIDFTSGREFVSLWQSMPHKLESLGTPLAMALSVADGAMHQARERGLMDGRFRVVVVTDGEPTCNDSLDAMTRTVAAWHQEGIETWVIGLPGSPQGATTLDALARAGGTGAVTYTDNADQLSGELQAASR
jgi:hypothetical protein